MSMRCSYVVPMRWMVIYKYEVPGRALNLSSNKLPIPGSSCGSSPSRKNPHGRTGYWTQGLMISSEKLTTRLVLMIKTNVINFHHGINPTTAYIWEYT
jgi:hypothetical protein